MELLSEDSAFWHSDVVRDYHQRFRSNGTVDSDVACRLGDPMPLVSWGRRQPSAWSSVRRASCKLFSISMELWTRGVTCCPQMASSCSDSIFSGGVAEYMIDPMTFSSLCRECRIGDLIELSSSVACRLDDSIVLLPGGTACCLDDPVTVKYCQLSI